MRRGRRPGKRGKGSKVGIWKNKGFDGDRMCKMGRDSLPSFPLFTLYLLLMG